MWGDYKPFELEKPPLLASRDIHETVHLKDYELGLARYFVIRVARR